MKFARVLALMLAVLMLTTGCAERGDNGNSDGDASGMLPEMGSALEDGVEDLKSGLEDGMSRLEEGTDELVGGDSREDELESSKEESSEDTSAAAAMSTDFSEIGALDATSDSGFPGGPVDDLNRPGGPVAYQQKYGKYDAHFIVPDSEQIYLTFDEGYENGYTSRILDVLKEKNVKAVFFVTMPYVKAEPELVKRMIQEGHTVGNHSTAHQSFPTMTLQDAADDLKTLHDYVQTVFHYEMTLFRPPEGAFSEQTLALAQQMGYKTILWSFAHRDWETDNQPLNIEAADTIVTQAHPGEIMLLHAVSKTNTEILGDVIDRLRQEGYTFADDLTFAA